MFDLTGHSAFITGSSQGVGRAIAISLARAGADIVLHGLHRDEQAAKSIELCKQCGVNVQFIAGDLSRTDNNCVTELAAQVYELAPSIDLVVNNAGGYFDVPFLEMDAAMFEKTMRLNVFSYFLLTQWFARRWVAAETPGRVLMIGSINGRLAERTHTAYDTSKGAVEMMVKSLCVELAPHGIRVNGLGPGLFYTPLTATALDDVRTRAWMELHTPNGQVPGPEVAGGAAVFLLSDAAAHVNGQMLLVDGGMSAWQQPPAP
jgi:NAD(P)-dependent dehydrogenase (short-subunit alcohol dehydrogenase family)